MQAVVGLGNPGRRYDFTRHNFGFRVIDFLALRLDGVWTESLCYVSSKIGLDSEALILVKPKTFMNKSGDAVEDLLRRFSVDLKDLLVVVDDVHLDLGSVRLRSRGSHGGHKGLCSIIETVGSGNFPRLRLGVGMPQGEIGLVDYVLGVFGQREIRIVEKVVQIAADGVMCWKKQGLSAAMNCYNRR